MQIDWLTVAAQWLNFLVLMWLLQRFLYQPIVRAMDKRQQAIDAQLEQAAEKAELAEQNAENYRNKLSELEAHRTVLMAAAREAADAEREKLTRQARDDIETLSRQWRQEVEREQAEAKQQLKQAFGQLVMATARHALQDLCGLDLQQALLDNFLQRLQTLGAEQKHQLAEAAAGDLAVACSFELDAGQRQRIEAALRVALNREPSLSFQTLADSCCGIMLITSAYTLEWRLEQYFADLDADLTARLALGGQPMEHSHVQ